MKWDKLENYILTNRDGMDSHKPPKQIWQKIEARLAGDGSSSKILYWQVAAVLFFVLSLGLIFNNLSTEPQVISLSMDDEFNSTEQYYFEVIQNKESILTSYFDQYPNLTKEFKNDLAELETNYKNLKVEFKTTASEEVVNALILNLQLQQSLLNNQLKIIQLIEKENEDISI